MSHLHSRGNFVLERKTETETAKSLQTVVCLNNGSAVQTLWCHTQFQI